MVRTVFYITPSVELLGARVSLVELVTHLDPERYRPVVMCPREGPLTQKLKELGIEYRIVHFGNWRKVKHWPLIPAAVYNLTEYARQEKAVLWHSNEFWVFPYAYLSAKRMKIPAVCHFRCSRRPDQLPPKKIRNYYVPRADKIIAVSKSREIIFSDIPESHSKFTVVPNGVDMTRFKSMDRDAFRKEIGINGNEFLIGMVGPVSEHKGVEEFIHAASKVASELTNARFAIIGPDRPHSFTVRMQELVKHLNMGSQISFTGFRHDIPGIMTSLDVLVTPSRVEAFGRVILEAMAAGTPIIASNVGGIPEIISSDEYGILVPPEQSDALASALIDLLKDPGRRKSLTEKAKAHVDTHFSIENHAQQIQKIYDEVLDHTSE